MNDACAEPVPSDEAMLSFNILKSIRYDGIEHRLGRLVLQGRPPVHTPHYIAVTSRGPIPHISPDMMRSHTQVNGVYVALEDFIEKAPRATPPVYRLQASPTESPLRRFIALQDNALLVLGPRRVPPVPCPGSNTNSAISILTAVGFRQLEAQDYIAAARRLRPDIVIGLGDYVTHQKSGVKRIEKMGDRTSVWTKELIRGISSSEEEPVGEDDDDDEDHHSATTNGNRPAIFAPILPIPLEQQSFYIEDLQDEDNLLPHISGLVIHDTSLLPSLPQPLTHLPRLSLDKVSTPDDILRQISLENQIDLFTIPFINGCSDSGLAFVFSFPSSPNNTTTTTTSQPSQRHPLALNLWLPEHSASLLPLQANCSCYTCANHHRAYVHHLLTAKEMLAWTLLQLHNLHVMDEFFAGVRESITRGGFEDEKRRFERVYESAWPERTGEGPRVRGYMFRSVGGGLDRKRNEIAYRALADVDVDVDDEEVLSGEGLAELAVEVEVEESVDGEEGRGKTWELR
ncbi:MAG: hypothetical protein M1816_003191 [Peltula sp. TS41687]|nr:MAG: hypothetical protein M1816_003191 [Peltula sp. TS41687]